jgi:hypothetical protein
MALTIQGNIETNAGISLTECYARTQYKMNDSSSSVVIIVDYWVNEDAYTNNLSSFIPTFNVTGRYDYDRTTDGSDVLLFTQNVIKEQLEGLGFSVVISEL